MKGRIIIGSDVVPTSLNLDRFISGDAEALVGEELLSILRRADYRIFNLEVPLTDNGEPILKSGPNLIAPTAALEGYLALGIDALSLANNHTLDQGKRAFLETAALLRKNGIATLGGGATEDEVKRPIVVELLGKRIGFLSFCEHEFSWFEDYGVGARGFDPLYSLDEIEEFKARVDYLAVLYHGGREHYRYPSPNLQRTCRRIAEKGADLVLCQHSHCVGAEETWRGSRIIYGVGNSLFVKERMDECWQSAILPELTVSEDGFELKLYPIEAHGVGVRLSHENKILADFEKRSREILEEGFVEEEYKRLISEIEPMVREHLGYFAEALGEPGTVRGAASRNIINCDPHREAIVAYLTERHGLK